MSSLGSFLKFSLKPWLFINTFYCCRDWVLGSEVERLSFCELEVDILASDILNKLEIGGNKKTETNMYTSCWWTLLVNGILSM